jgi:hypothetical protein
LIFCRIVDEFLNVGRLSPDTGVKVKNRQEENEVEDAKGSEDAAVAVPRRAKGSEDP